MRLLTEFDIDNVSGITLYAAIIFSIYENILDHLEIKRFVQPKSSISIAVCFNKDILRTKRLETMQALRKGNPPQGIPAEILVTA